jgi:PAS domain S-box-containing protein
MARPTTRPTANEVTFAEHEIIVSKTDIRGVVTYANDVFLRVAGYSEAEVLGQAHNFIRHPDMPRCVFALLWDTIKSGQEIFAYVKNMARSGDFYWVFAHVTPSYNAEGQLTGYHSNRRSAYRDAIPKVADLYAKLRQEELKHADASKAVEAGKRLLLSVLDSQKISYAEFVFSLSKDTRLVAA